MLTFNSARDVRRALDSVRDFDEILICDGGSTDATLAIAREFGCRVIEQDARYKNPDNTLKDIGGLRNQCVDAAKHDAVLILDSDETISEELKDEIAKVVRAPSDVLVYRIPMRMIIGGHVIEYSSNYPGYQYRFFNRRSGARFIKPVHNKLAFDKKICIGTFIHPWNVFWDAKDVENYTARSFKYIPEEVKSFSDLSVRGYFSYFVPWHGRVIVAVIVKTVRDRLLHPFGACMPLKIEIGRVRFQARLIVEMGKVVFAKRKAL